MVTSLSRAVTRPQASIAAVAKRWPGPMTSVLAWSMRRSSRRRPCIGGYSPGAGPIREVPDRWRTLQRRRPPCSSRGGNGGRYQTHAAPTPPLSSREPSVQMMSRRLHSLAVARAPALSSTTMWPEKRRLASISYLDHLSTAEGVC